ncbi:hypothetical protein EX895_002729 [Sporisorium graminicola]|uniref:SOK1 protein n=1 Tax=Sporisorium graminicola TaxID=280036 RepID=A0A4U7KW36_9BASI|nr:hypothetical protein EX895_002729 [Sporisorium graminicola]TKY88377.1 hypothetical protein EX895_002729 [Sporisorium graminicola]
MDASADDPQRFRVRRSPSIGSAAAPVTSAVRAGKRKLSTAAFGSSPIIGPHPPSSPITSEHPTDDLELKVKHNMQNASQIASTSRSNIDTRPDSCTPASDKAAANNVHPSSSAHPHFPDWQEQRRCHSILADYDYSPPAEDRRDPRTSNGRIVMPVSSTQPQVMVAGAAHGSQSNSSDPHTSLQQPPIASRHHETDPDARTSPLARASSTTAHETTCQVTAPRFAPLQNSVSQTSLSVPPSPERGLSPSASFPAFHYQAPQSRASPCSTSSTRTEPHANTLEQNPAGTPSQVVASDVSGSLTSMKCPPKHAAEPASTETSFTAASARPLSRVSSQHFNEQQATPSLTVPTHSNPAQSTAASHGGFQLQPVPLAKRRRVEDGSASGADQRQRDAHALDDTRRFSDAGLPLRKTQSPKRPNPTVSSESVDANNGSHTVSSKTALKYAASHPKAAASTRSSIATGALASNSFSNVTDSTASSEARMLVRSTNLEKAAAPSSMAPLRKQQQTLFSRRMPRLVRAQSVPNLRAKATLDLSAPSHHRLILPSHWASYVSSQARQGREGAKATNSRSSKGFAFNAAHYSVASSSSRSRSTFTPTLHPPITRHTLRELDLFEILKNPQLRHDVVFDPNVQFRPNFDGERGRRKREAGERYWTAVVREIETGCTCTAFSHGQLLPCTCKANLRLRRGGGTGTQEVATPLQQQSRIPSRIPLLVQELRTICLSILPSNYPADNVVADTEEAGSASTAEEDKGNDTTASDEATSSRRKKATVAASSATSWAATHHQLIAQTLDPHLISQQLQHGVLDVPALITFMGSILKLHCAPMRDEAIERMVDVVCVDRNIGKGLRLCFEILELMKLDIANHQLRSARPFLVETAVDFEIRWFKEQIEQGKMSLERTTTWIQQALGSSEAATSTPRNEAVAKAFNQGMLQLIFDVPGSPPLVSPVATPLGSPSSSSLNNTFASYYPETFQFDAYRMMTFHNDVSDLTIVYMLVLLFRQLCSMPLDGGEAVPARVGSIVQTQLKAIKSEIWCLVNDANLCLSSSSALPPTPTAVSGVTSPTARRPAGVDGKLFVGSAGGFAKLGHPRWRRAMQNVLLQVAARAAAVQIAARDGSSEPSTVKIAAPSAPTQKLLNSWMDTNLRSGSALHKICQSRLHNVVLGMLGDKVRNGLQPSSTSMAPSAAAPTGVTGTGQKRTVPVELQDTKIGDATPTKRLRSGDEGAAITAAVPSSVSTAAAASSVNAASPWDTAMSRAGLEPFAAEIRLLSDRIAKVATFHLRVFRNLYEGIESGRHKSGGGTQ